MVWPKIYVFAATSDSDKFFIQEDGSTRVQGHGSAARVSADGSFKLRGLGNGLYSVTVVTGLGSKQLPDGYRMKSIVVDNRNVLKQKLQIPVPAGKSLRITIGLGPSSARY
jgi:hypothetical protein